VKTHHARRKFCALLSAALLLCAASPLANAAAPATTVCAASSVLAPTASGTAVKQNSSAVIDYSNVKDGYVMVSWTGGGSPKLKVQTKGPSGVTYTYDLRTDGAYETFPMSDGSGDYIVSVFKNVSDNKYASVISAKFTASLTNEFAPFLRPNQYVNFTKDSAAVAKAAALVTEAGAKENLDKVAAVYKYVINNITYDTEKAKSVKSGYLPDVDKVMSSGKGICFDYAALMAAMLRSQNVPVKLVVGNAVSGKNVVYHAWLNVWSEKDGWVDSAIYFDGSVWKLMDPTFASSGKQNSSIMKYIGDGSNYTAKFLY